MGQPKQMGADDFDSVFGDELEPGHTLMHGQYTIEEFLNAGGFGITYLARDSLDRIVVIKECFPGSLCRRTTTSVQARSRAHTKELASVVNLFVQEARSLALLDHPNIVGVHQVFEENNTAYMALDFVEGRDLLDMIENPTDIWEPEVVEGILRKLLSAVGCIHDQGILHRDISPDNVLIQPNMEPILIDFGAAQQEAGKQSRILSAMRVVKDGYSPQEFYISGAEQGKYSDLYALAATFYHLITGELPANSQTRLSAVASGAADPYVPLVNRMPGYSDEFLQGIDKALEILPGDRIASAAHWLKLLDGDKINEVVSQPQKVDKKDASPRKSYRALLLGTAAILVPIVAGLVYSQTGGSTSDSDATATAALSQQIETAAAANAPADDALIEPTDTAGPGAGTSPTTGSEDTEDTSAASAEQSMLALLAAQGQPSAVDAPDESVGSTPAPEQPGLADTVPGESVPSEEADGSVEADATAEADPAVVAAIDTAPVESVESIVPEVDGPQLPEPPLEQESISEDQPVVTAEEVRTAVLVTDPAAIEIYDLPQIMSGWSIDLEPLLANATDTIFEINALPIETAAQIDTVLRNNFAAPDGAETEVTVLVGPDQASATYETFTVPVVHETLFLNGMMFETRMIEGAWTTNVVSSPSGFDFEEGDVLVGDLATGNLLDSRTSLPDLLVQAIADERSKLTLAIRRDSDVLAIDLAIPQ